MFRTVRVAVVQAAPVVLDAEASVEKACDLVAGAARGGAELVVLPECFVSIYPTRLWAAGLFDQGDAGRELWRRIWEQSVEVDGPLVARLVGVCAEHAVHLVIGVNEREAHRPGGSLYNTLLVLGPSGVLHRHRKLMPTFHERLFHGQGDGTDLGVVETPVGRIGGLICWENRMPLARYAVYRGGPQIWVAPTADDGDGWGALVRAIAIEAGAFAASCCQYLERSAYPEDFPLALPERDVLHAGGSLIVGPTGEVLAGPLRGGEGTVVADCDLAAAADVKQWFDVAGHYAREDVLLPLLGRPL